MKKKQFESLCRRILPDLPGFACKGWLLYARPVSHILRGFSCNISGFDATIFTVNVFVLPLYVPTQHLYYNYGDRLRDERGCDKWWSTEEPDLANDLLRTIQREGLPFLDAVRDPSQLVALIERRPGNTYPHSLEAIAYSLLMVDEYTAGQQALERLAMALDRKIAWQSEMMDRAEQLTRELTSDPQRVKQKLAEWEQATVKHLGVA